MNILGIGAAPAAPLLARFGERRSTKDRGDVGSR
jgi:hypothetical protein